MSDLISRAALLAEYDRVHVGAAGGARKLIAEAPAVDAVEVVRCKDCKHCAIDKYVKRPFCILNGEVRPNGHIWFGVGVTEEHYCSYGERREKGAVD